MLQGRRVFTLDPTAPRAEVGAIGAAVPIIAVATTGPTVGADIEEDRDAVRALLGASRA